MSQSSGPKSPAGQPARAPAFTLATALAWLGHDCPGDCPPIAANRPAKVWFTIVPGTDQPTWAETLVDVEFGAPLETSLDFLAEINDCVRPDRIRVRDRSTLDRTALLTRFPGPNITPERLH